MKLEPLDGRAAKVRALGRRAVVAPGDVRRDEEDLPRAIAAARAALGPLDIVVANDGGESAP